MRFDQHPTVQRIRQETPARKPPEPVPPISAPLLRQLALECGADDVGLVELERPELADQRDDIRKFFPQTRTLISFVVRMNVEPLRSPARSVANLEFHHTGDETNEVARRLVRRLQEQGIPATNPAMGFPMEMDRFPGKIWVVSHKPVAVAAGLGMIGLHRNVIHPRFGNFILLGTVLIGAEATAYDQPISFNPCLGCKLCVAACPVGAIGADGAFDFSACYTHNYREFMGGFTDWAEAVASSGSRAKYREQVAASESASLWQSLAFGPNYKAAYCLSVCPAGEDVIRPFLDNQKQHLDTIVRPLQDKAEPVYVVPGSDAEAFVQRRFPHKTPRRVRNSLIPTSIAGFLSALPHVFQRGAAKELEATYHFRFTGREPAKATVRISGQTCRVEHGLSGTAQLRITADSDSWLRFLARERSLPRLLLTGRLRLWGHPRWLVKFGKCFPS